MALSQNFQNRFIELADELDEIRIANYFNISIEYLIANTDDEHFDKSAHHTPFKDRLLKLQKEKSISTVYELSQVLHIHRNNIAQWNKLNCIPLIDDMVIIADFFDVSIDYLLGRTDDRTPYK